MLFFLEKKLWKNSEKRLDFCGAVINRGLDQDCQMVYFQTKIPIWVNFRSWVGRSWYFYGHLVYYRAIWYITYMVIWSILRPFVIFYGNLIYIFPFLVRCTKEDLATLDWTTGTPWPSVTDWAHTRMINFNWLLSTRGRKSNSAFVFLPKSKNGAAKMFWQKNALWYLLHQHYNICYIVVHLAVYLGAYIYKTGIT
jgi:hypothetical protein